ncbi:MAG: DUF2497 domain-containing protein [Pseudomonadota bacterium]
MEDILASIRRIISEDEEEGTGQSAAAPVTPAAPSPAPKVEIPEPPTAAPINDDASPSANLASVTSVGANFVESRQEVASDDTADKRFATEEVEMIKKNVATAVREDEGLSIVDEAAANAASSAFSSLSQSIRVGDSDGPGRTLEDIVTEMLRPMVKDWLDANLPTIVEEKVEEEVQRISRRRR